MKGSVSGGTLASGVESLKEAAAGKKAAADPYGLNPPGAPRGPDTADYWCDTGPSSRPHLASDHLIMCSYVKDPSASQELPATPY